MNGAQRNRGKERLKRRHMSVENEMKKPGNDKERQKLVEKDKEQLINTLGKKYIFFSLTQ